jgi:hypothetical protein
MAAKSGILQKVFHIYPDEQRNAVLFAFLGFLWAFGATCALKFADALFLLHVGAEHLPTAYTLNAFGMFGMAFVLLYSFHHFSSYTIYRTTILVGITFYSIVLLCRFLEIGSDSHWFWYSLKLGGFFMFAILMTCYWTFIDQYHHLQHAKRLYSLFSSMIFLGAAATGVLMNSGYLDLEHLIVLIIIIFSFTYYWIKRITTKVPLVAHEDMEPEGPSEHGNAFQVLLQAILASPFTMLLMMSNFLTYLLLIITEYNYMFTFQNHFAAQQDAALGGGTEALLTQFLGKCLASVSVTNLVFGLFIYSRLVRRFGISSMLVVSPLLLILAFSGWSVSTSLFFPLIGFFVVEGTLYVIDDSNFNLLLNAVPTKLKYKIRVMIESFFEPVGMLISAGLLSFFQAHSKLLGLILAGCSLCIAMTLRSRYVKALFSNLSQNAIDFSKSVEDRLGKMNEKQQKAAESRLLGILISGDEEAQLFACEGLLCFEDPAILKKILSYASEMQAPAKIKFLELLEHSIFERDNLVFDTLQEWLHTDFDDSLKSAVNLYLAKNGLLHPEKVVNDLKSSDIQLRGAAIVALKKSLAHQSPTTAAYNRTLAAQHLRQLLDSKQEEELCMGLEILGIDGDTNEVDILIPFLKNPSLAIARRASESLSQVERIDSIRQAPRILESMNQINDSEVRLNCLKALGKINDSSLVADIIKSSLHYRPTEKRLIETIIYKMGLRTVPRLLSLTKDTHMPDKCRVLAGTILGRLSLPQLRAILSDILRQEIDRAYFYFYHYHTIQDNNPGLDLHMLKDVLITDYHSVLDFIIQLLAASGEIEDEELLSRSLRSRNPKVRSQVVEMLEKTCEPQIFRLLQPLVNDIPYEEKMKAYVKSGHKPLSLTDLLDKLGESAAQIDQIIAATMKYNLNLPNWRESLRQQMLKRDEIFHHFAYELLES